jgi:small subunit ribosomal protein S8
MVNYSVGDFLIRIKNAAMSGRQELEVQSTKFAESVAEALKREGILREVKRNGGTLSVRLAYRKKEPVMINLRLISSPGLRIYMSADEIAARNKPSILILSTTKGVVSSKEAMKYGVGGEVIAEIW